VAETGADGAPPPASGSLASSTSGRDQPALSPGGGSALGRTGSRGAAAATSVNGSTSHATTSVGPAGLLSTSSSAAAAGGEGSGGGGAELLSTGSLEAGVLLKGSLSVGSPGEPGLSLNVPKRVVIDSLGSTPYASLPSTGAHTPLGLSSGGSAP
jgi:hypothetical protein